MGYINKNRKKEWDQRYRVEKWDEYMYRGIKNRSRKYNLDLDFDSNYIMELYKKQNGKCYWSNVIMEIGADKNNSLQPSPDRINPKLGYTKGNVVLCALFMNYGRGECTSKQTKSFLEKISEVSENKKFKKILYG